MKTHFLHSIITGIILLFTFQAVSLYGQCAQLVWSPSVDESITQYNIYRSSHPDSDFVFIASVYHPDSSYFDEGIEWDSIYYYAATSVDKSGNESGFSETILLEIPNPMPVELSSFAARAHDNDVILSWATATESNNYGFEIQRSSDNTIFETIGFVQGHGTTAAPKSYRYIDEQLTNGHYYYRLNQIDIDGTCSVTEVIEIAMNRPLDFRLDQNYPNPFNPTTTISYHLPQSSHVELIVYNTNGQEIRRLVDEFNEAGSHNIVWDCTDNTGMKVTSAVYYYRMKTSYGAQFRRMTVLK